MSTQIYRDEGKVEWAYYLKIGNNWYTDIADHSMNGEFRLWPIEEFDMIIKQVGNAAWMSYDNKRDYNGRLIKKKWKIHKITPEQFQKETGMVFNPLTLLLLFNIVLGYN
jgi:hypothetical protein